MATMTQRFHSGWNGLLERIERTRMRRDLLKRNDRVLADMGFSKELLEKGVSTWPWRREADHSTGFELPDVTPEMIDHYILEGRRQQAAEIHRLGRRAFAGMARAGRALTGWARDRRTRSLGKYNLG